MSTIEVKTVILEHGVGLPLPDYATAGAAAIDLVAALPASGECALGPGARALIPTGISIAIPDGYEAQIRPRSGLALKNGVTVLNTPGTIDSDYRGEVGVILMNNGPDGFAVKRGDRIAQMVFAPVTKAKLCVVESLDNTDRGGAGFGSTGR